MYTFILLYTGIYSCCLNNDILEYYIFIKHVSRSKLNGITMRNNLNILVVYMVKYDATLMDFQFSFFHHL